MNSKICVCLQVGWKSSSTEQQQEKKAGQQQKQVENTGSQNGRKSKINENCIWSESQPSCNFLLLMVAF